MTRWCALLLVAAACSSGGAATAADPVRYSSPVWSPDGRRILLVQSIREGDGFSDFKISVLDLRTRKLRDLGRHASFSARWSPNGRQILFEDGGAIFVMNADGSHARRLLG